VDKPVDNMAVDKPVDNLWKNRLWICGKTCGYVDNPVDKYPTAPTFRVSN
jgi:hypothetical protein